MNKTIKIVSGFDRTRSDLPATCCLSVALIAPAQIYRPQAAQQIPRCACLSADICGMDRAQTAQPEDMSASLSVSDCVFLSSAAGMPARAHETTMTGVTAKALKALPAMFHHVILAHKGATDLPHVQSPACQLHHFPSFEESYKGLGATTGPHDNSAAPSDGRWSGSPW